MTESIPPVPPTTAPAASADTPQETNASSGDYASPLLSWPGACPLPEDAAPAPHRIGVAWHYGDPLGEQRARLQVIDRSNERFLAVAGPDAAAFLNSLFSQKLDDLPAGESTQALNLDAQGHLLEHVAITALADGFLLSAPAPQVEAVAAYLARMVFWNEVTITPAPVALLSIITAPGETSAAAGTDTAEDASATAPAEVATAFPGLTPAAQVRAEQVCAPEWSGALLRPGLVGLPGADFGRGLGHWEAIVPAAALEECARALVAAGGQMAGLWAFEAFRVAQVLPVVGVDTDERSIPHEVPALLGSAVHLNKGCYRGQETVARVHNVGRSPRVLVRLLLDGSAPTTPRQGDAVVRAGRTVGRVGTIVDDYQWGPVALATLKRSALGEQPVTVGEAAATIDPDSVVRDEQPQAGRVAQARLRGQQLP